MRIIFFNSLFVFFLRSKYKNLYLQISYERVKVKSIYYRERLGFHQEIYGGNCKDSVIEYK
jgi:hypothetical protein